MGLILTATVGLCIWIVLWALAVKQKATAARIATVQGPPVAADVAASGADGLFFGASQPGRAATLFNAVAAAAPQIRLFGSSTLDNSAFAAALDAGAQRHTYVSAPGFLPADLNAKGAAFMTSFQAAYGHAPALGAIFGYEAVAAVLSVLHEAGSSANKRSTVVRDFLAINDRSSVLGTYSIRRGDPTIGPFVFSRFEAGQLTPFTFVQEQG
jgi:ABC-type branched-subunit amino acid transport system substrate-binding protein